jgi:pterin-4a-carbinolamine dehydratase
VTTTLAIPAGWRLVGERLVASFSFATYRKTVEFATAVAMLAVMKNHHPKVCFGRYTARVTLTTDDKGHPTEVDYAMAEQITKLAEGE